MIGFKMHSAFHPVIRWREQEDTSGKNQSTLTLPRNLRLHHENNANPWKKSSFEEDFILITEFSEKEGPRAVMTIPSGGGGSFDKNAFALHIMSVDFQSQNKHSDFSIQEDAQLVLTEKKSGTCAFVHHFTLYDIHARGYVRPFCMSYIAHSKKKILSSLENIMKEFDKIAKRFHFGNRVVFTGDLEQKLMDLLTLNEELCQNKRYSKNRGKNTSESVEKTQEYCDQAWKDTKKVVDALRPHMTDPLIVDQFKKVEKLAERQENSFSLDIKFPDDRENVFAEQEGPRPPLNRARSLSSLDELKTGDEDNVQLKTFVPAYMRNLHQLRHLHELCGWGAKEAINRLRNVASHFSQDDIAIAVEKTESALVDPLSSLLTLGRSVVLNFMPDVDLSHFHNHAKQTSLTLVGKLLFGFRQLKSRR